jgi:type VI secretion system protein ImpL
MLALLKNRVFLVALGLVLLALIVWFAGPYFAFADYKPLESVVARLVAIIVLAVAYAIYVQLRALKSARASQQLAKEVSKQEDSAAGTAGAGAAGAATSGDAAQLRKRFEEAVEALKQSKRGANLYELPWYIIIGPPGAGKTTVLVNSGLNFPLAQKFGKEALRGVGGTRNCDWWFTDEAILLDTAGRYTTQDSNARADAAGWATFLELLRKFRGRQPINGVIVAISASDLMALDEREREQHVVAIRERLDEIGRNLRIKVPVYVLVTKCDLIAGFSEFFEDLGQEARSQVWGTTFPIEASEAGTATEAFEAEFDQLIDRLQQRVLARMESERDVRRRVGILGFPQQMVTLKPLLSDLLNRAFTASGFDKQILLRGVYFTSGTQEGTPIDRMLGAIARSFGFSSAVAAPPAGRGKAYFIERLLKSVIFHESGLAGVNRRVQLQKIALQSAAYIACLVVLLLGLLWLIVSYNANASYIDEVAKATQALAPTQASAMAPGASLDMVLPELDALHDITAVAEKYQGNVPWHMRVGLYRGAALGGEARDAYTRELNATIVPALRSRFEQALQANVGAPDRLYEYLKAYLMLGETKHRDCDYLHFLGQNEWPKAYPQDPATAQRLTMHFEQLLPDDRLKSVPLNSQAVEQARFALKNATLPVLMYDRLKVDYLDDSKRAVRLDVAAGAGADRALARRSGKPLSQPVPALYTRAVFNEINSTGKYQLTQQFLADSWVFGENAFDLRRTGSVFYDVLNLYEADYIRTWDEVVKDVGIKHSSDTREFADVLDIISSPASPLKGFLTVVATNTDLLKPDTSATGQAAGALDKAVDAKLAGLKKILGEPPQGAPPPGSKVTAYFEPIRRLVEGPPGQAPIDQMLASLQQQARRLQSTGSGVGQQSALDPAVQAAVADAKRSLDVMAKQMPAPLGNIVSEVALRSEAIVNTEARGELARRYAQQVVSECRERVEGFFPLNPTSATDAKLEDFTRVFGPGGVFDTFYRDNLAALVDTSGPQWRWREGAAAGPVAMLQQFQRVQRIRDIYFAPGAHGPEAKFSLLADSLDGSVARFTLTVDGQPFEYRYESPRTRPMTWPGTVGEASFAFEDRGGRPIPGPSFQGPWAWFRLLGQAHVERDSDTRFKVTFTAGGKSMRVIMDAASIRNPFARNELAGFHCGM